MKDYGLYGPGSATWKIASETVVMLGGTRAVLMQLAHPLVGAGVCQHSSYMTEPLARTERTFILGQNITFGPHALSHEAARTINRLHTHVHGELAEAAGAFAAGTQYKARDPELLLWVHATLIDTILSTYQLFIGPLSLAEQEQYYQESKALVHLLGLAPQDMPATVQDLLYYVNEMVYSDKLAATTQSRQLIQHVLYPRSPTLLRPFLHLNKQVTCALLPQPIRDIFGLEWSKGQQRAFDFAVRGIRLVVPRLPRNLRILPITRRLMGGAPPIPLT